ncbi:M23 family metallopeptidase [Psychrobacter pygoscelis]|uniref:M23 family metallopeptidase n=1 Tax=Psychrobacter pygoscelis TaxID=2488563 RepID=UPI00103E5A69|nr:M23 family metallopeptidase [Psychrobacter pygoscelis]
MITKNTWPKWQLAIGTALIIGASGCATRPTYQSGVQSSPKITTNAQGVPNYYRVQRGDTVSQIAARYGLNYRHIGAINGLDSQYTIYSGQWLKLWQGDNSARSNTRNTSRTSPSRTSLPPMQSTPTSPSYGSTAADTKGYIYPTSNQIIRNFDERSGVMGMWFAGREGDPVVASQSGVVLYAGDGLPEYGNLIMIRHGQDYITAYAHNSQLLVQEGDQVQRGQQIATMGRTGQTDQVALEFQVRHKGNPIDPRSTLGR